MSKNQKTDKPKREQNKNEFLAQVEVLRDMDNILPGDPGADVVVVRSLPENYEYKRNSPTEDKQRIAVTMVYQVLEVGPEVKNKKIKKGSWVQLSGYGRYQAIEWGNNYMLLPREHEILWVFDRNPHQEFELRMHEKVEQKRSHIVSEGSLLRPAVGKS